MSSFSNSGDDQQEWISVSDLMAALMVLFALVAILGLFEIEGLEKGMNPFAQKEAESMPGISCENSPKTVICTISADDHFESGQASLNVELQEAIDQLFPDLLEYSMQQPIDSLGFLVKEIVIEGHTSSEHMLENTEQGKYHRNLLLSQLRSANVMNHVLQMYDSQDDIEWLKPRLSANGLSSRELKRTPSGREDARSSRRVEIKLLINDGYVLNISPTLDQ